MHPTDDRHHMGVSSKNNKLSDENGEPTPLSYLKSSDMTNVSTSLIRFIQMFSQLVQLEWCYNIPRSHQAESYRPANASTNHHQIVHLDANEQKTSSRRSYQKKTT